MHMTPAPEWVAWAELGMKIVWIAIAALLAPLMARRGHDGGLWALAGLVLGPAAIIAAMVARRRARRREPIIVAAGGEAAAGTAVTVVVDPADDAAHPVVSDAMWAGARRVVFVTVIGCDTFDVGARRAEERHALQALRAAAASVYARGLDPGLIILEGRPDDAIRSFVRRDRPDLLLVPPTPLGQRLAAKLAGEMGLAVAEALPGNYSPSLA